MNPSLLAPIANHLWQSTIVVGIAATLALALRKSHARFRYWIWLAASMKFLIPFSVLITLGGMIPWPQSQMTEPGRLPAIVESVAQPFVLEPTHIGPSVRILDSSTRAAYIQESLTLAWLLGSGVVLLAWFKQWRRVRLIIRESKEVTRGRGFEIVSRLQGAIRFTSSLRLLTSTARLEPGVVGIFRPVLLLPDGIQEQLTDEELEAILAHELTHVHRRDNLFASLHGIVEAIFWFHPVVWWIRERLIAERERACDEAVVRIGNNPEIYAEGILKICELYLKAPLDCASGVSGSSLRKRIEAIMTRNAPNDLNVMKKVALACAGILGVIVPVAIGMSGAPQTRAQAGAATPLSFEVISIKPNNSADRATAGARILPGGNVSAANVTLWDLILGAFWVPKYLVSGEPDWIKVEKFDIEAKVPPNVIPKGLGDRARNDYTRRMMQTMLKERFKLAVHRETKEMPVYELVVAKNGPKLTKAVGRDCSDNKCHKWGPGNPTMQGGFPGISVDMDDLLDILRIWLDRPAVNKTNIQGLFDIHLQFNPWPGAQSTAQRNDGSRETINADLSSLPDIFTALQEQLGLKLESRKGQVETIIIDHAERPSAN